MNKKHMNAQLCRVFEDLIGSIKDEEVKRLMNDGTIITGGALVSLLTGETPNDYDMYFKDFKTCYKVAEYFINEFNKDKGHEKAKLKIKDIDYISYEEALLAIEKGREPRIKIFIQSIGVASNEEYEEDNENDDEIQTNIEIDSDLEKIKEEKPKYRPKFLSSNEISLSGKIQLVIRFYGEPDKLHENYDFIHCTNYWTSWERKVALKQQALEAIINKELIYVGSKYPLCSIIRTRKFIKRGWSINAGQYLKMAMQLNDLDLKDVKVLEDQLVGVDSAYFSMLINALQNKIDSESNFQIDNNYVAAIVDKIF